MVMWIGQQLPADIVSKVFGVTSQAQVNMDMVRERGRESDLSMIKLIHGFHGCVDGMKVHVHVIPRL